MTPVRKQVKLTHTPDLGKIWGRFIAPGMSREASRQLSDLVMCEPNQAGLQVWEQVGRQVLAHLQQVYKIPSENLRV